MEQLIVDLPTNLEQSSEISKEAMELGLVIRYDTIRYRDQEIRFLSDPSGVQCFAQWRGQLIDLGLNNIYYKEDIGVNGMVIYLGKEITSMFRLADVLLDKEEISLNVSFKLKLNEAVLQGPALKGIVINKISRFLSSQGFPCFECRKFTNSLIKISDPNEMPIRYALMMFCGSNDDRSALFEVCLRPVKKK